LPKEHHKERMLGRLVSRRPIARTLTCCRSSSSRPPSASSSGNSGASDKPKPSIPDHTTFFKMSNPELMLDEKNPGHWRITGGVALFFAVYLGWAYYKDLQSGVFDPPAESTANILKVLPDGRVLMKDGSIQAAPTSRAA
jgi:hypothetical protein